MREEEGVQEKDIKWFGEFPSKESYPYRIHVYSEVAENGNAIIAGTFIPPNPDTGGYIQIRMHCGELLLIRYDTIDARPPKRLRNAKILFDSRKEKKRQKAKRRK